MEILLPVMLIMLVIVTKGTERLLKKRKGHIFTNCNRAVSWTTVAQCVTKAEYMPMHAITQ